MSWQLSQFRAGDLVEIRSREEILATLDADGCKDNLPFMPEMLQYCGQQVRVGAVAHKTCETARKTAKGRKLTASVHLTGLRCDGSAHGGCQAACNLFWKDLWLKPVPSPNGGAETRPAGACTEAALHERARVAPADSSQEPRYSCQATRLYEATSPLPSWDLRQYIYDIRTGNHKARHALRVLWFAFLTRCLRHAPFGYRFIKSLRERMHRRWMGRDVPDFEGIIPLGQPTPTGRLAVSPGDVVRIKSKEEIVRTLDRAGKNRGMRFDIELAPFCGRTAKVLASVTKIIDERTGAMMPMKQPCITLENVACRSYYSDCRLLCPRAIPSYWREIWLEKVAGNALEPEAPAK